MLIQNCDLEVESIRKQDVIFSFDLRIEEDDILRAIVVPK